MKNCNKNCQNKRIRLLGKNAIFTLPTTIATYVKHQPLHIEFELQKKEVFLEEENNNGVPAFVKQASNKKCAFSSDH